MFGQLLNKHGLGSRLVPYEAAGRSTIGSLDVSGDDGRSGYVEIAGTPAHLRYLLRRLRKHAPEAKSWSGSGSRTIRSFVTKPSGRRLERRIFRLAQGRRRTEPSDRQRGGAAVIRAGERGDPARSAGRRRRDRQAGALAGLTAQLMPSDFRSQSCLGVCGGGVCCATWASSEVTTAAAGPTSVNVRARANARSIGCPFRDRAADASPPAARFKAAMSCGSLMRGADALDAEARPFLLCRNHHDHAFPSRRPARRLSAGPIARHRHRDAGAQPASGQALRGADLDRRRRRRRGADPQGRTGAGPV